MGRLLRTRCPDEEFPRRVAMVCPFHTLCAYPAQSNDSIPCTQLDKLIRCPQKDPSRSVSSVRHLSFARPRRDTLQPLGPIHTGRGTRRAMRCKQMGPIDVNGGVHTACKQHQRKNIQIYVRIASCVLCGLGLLPAGGSEGGYKVEVIRLVNLQGEHAPVYMNPQFASRCQELVQTSGQGPK